MSTEEELNEVKEALAKANAEAAKHRHTASDLKRKFEGFDPEEFKALKQKHDEAEQKRLQDEGEFKTLKESIETKYQQQIADEQKKRQSLEAKYNEALISQELTKSFHDCISPEDAINLTRGNIGVDEDGVFVKDPEGNPLLEMGKRVPVETFAKKWLDEKPFLKKANGGGSGSDGNNGDASGKRMKRADFDRISDPTEKARVGRTMEIID